MAKKQTTKNFNVDSSQLHNKANLCRVWRHRTAKHRAAIAILCTKLGW